MWLRTASKDDIQSIHQLLFKTTHATLDDLIGVGFADRLVNDLFTADSLRKALYHPSSEFIIADDGERLHGAAYATLGGVKTEPEMVTLHFLVVDPENQRAGVGQKLLVEIEESFSVARRIRTQIFEKNVKALNFFESQGYKKTSENAKKFDLPVVVMEKSIF